MKQFKCSDLGMTCDFVAADETEEGIRAQIAEHGKTVHGHTEADMTPEMITKIDTAITDV